MAALGTVADEAEHNVSDAGPTSLMLMPNGSRKPNWTTVGAKERITWSIFCQDVPNIPSFNLVLYSISQFLKLMITKMFC